MRDSELWGRVLTPFGNLRDAVITLRDGKAAIELRSGEEGAFRFPAVPAGRPFRLQVTHPVWGLLQRDCVAEHSPHELHYEANASVNVTVIWDRLTRSRPHSIRLFRLDGEARTEIVVEAEAVTAWDSVGREPVAGMSAVIMGLAPSDYEVQARDWSTQVSKRFSIPRNGAEVGISLDMAEAVQLRRDTTLTVRVLLEGSILARETIDYSFHEGKLVTVGQATTDASGRFRIHRRPLLPGSFLTLRHRRAGKGVHAFSSATSPTAFDVELPALRGTVTLRLVTPDGFPVPYAAVSLQDLQNPKLPFLRYTDGYGACPIDDLEPGEQRVVVKLLSTRAARTRAKNTVQIAAENRVISVIVPEAGDVVATVPGTEHALVLNPIGATPDNEVCNLAVRRIASRTSAWQWVQLPATRPSLLVGATGPLEMVGTSFSKDGPHGARALVGRVITKPADGIETVDLILAEPIHSIRVRSTGAPAEGLSFALGGGRQSAALGWLSQAVFPTIVPNSRHAPGSVLFLYASLLDAPAALVGQDGQVVPLDLRALSTEEELVLSPTASGSGDER